MTFQEFDDNDIKILAELFSHPLNLPHNPLKRSHRYARYLLWGLIALEMFILIISVLQHHSTIIMMISIFAILLAIYGLITQYFFLYLHKNYFRILKRQYRASCPVIENDFMFDRHRELNLHQIKRIVFYQGLYFIIFEKHIAIVKPLTATPTEVQAFFSQYADIIFQTYTEPFVLNDLRKR